MVLLFLAALELLEVEVKGTLVLAEEMLELDFVLLWVLLNERFAMLLVADAGVDGSEGFLDGDWIEPLDFWASPSPVIPSDKVTILTPIAVCVRAGMKTVDTPGEGCSIVLLGWFEAHADCSCEPVEYVCSASARWS